MADSPPAVHFATSLVPHRSLSPEGFKWLIRGAIAANLLIGLPMMLLGAWPVLGFMGLDVWLLWFLFKRSYLDARRSETLLLTDRELIIDRVAPDGEREQHRLDAYWLRVELLGKDSDRLVLVSRSGLPPREQWSRILARRPEDDASSLRIEASARPRIPRSSPFERPSVFSIVR